MAIEVGADRGITITDPQSHLGESIEARQRFVEDYRRATAQAAVDIAEAIRYINSSKREKMNLLVETYRQSNPPQQLPESTSNS